MLKKLIIGCGKNWKTSDYLNIEHHEENQRLNRQEPPDYEQHLHPDDIHSAEEYDTLDSDRKINPTYCININEYDTIENEFEHGFYDFILLERLPAHCLTINDCVKSFSHLLKDDGLLVFVYCGAIIAHFYDLCCAMQNKGFQHFLIDVSLNVIFFLKCDLETSLIKSSYHITNDRYLNKLLSYKIMNFNSQPCLRFEKKNLQDHAWKIEKFLAIAKANITSKDNLGKKRKESERILKERNLKWYGLIRFSFYFNQVSIQIIIKEENLKYEIINAIFSINDNMALNELRKILWENYDFLHTTTHYSRYEALYNGLVTQVRHTWAKIDRAIAIKMVTNFIGQFPDYDAEKVNDFFREFAFIKEAKKRHLFLKPWSSDTYNIFFSKKGNQEKVFELNSKKNKLLASIASL